MPKEYVVHLKPGRYFKYGHKKVYIHCGVYHKTTNEWGYVTENAKGVLGFIVPDSKTTPVEITESKWRG